MKKLISLVVVSIMVSVNCIYSDARIIKKQHKYKSKYTIQLEEESLLEEATNRRLNTLSLIADKESKMRKLITSQVGKPYIWGANGPSAFDCSGLVNWVYKEIGNPLNCARCTTWSYPSMTYRIAEEDLKVGDILLYEGHVMISIGGGQIVHAKSPKYGVIYDTVQNIKSRHKEVEFRRFK